MHTIIPIERIENKIMMIRGQKVMLDRDLAELYGVQTGHLNQRVNRNIERFPEDFMFILSNDEFDILISQFGISKRGGTRFPPRAFTEQGVAMLSSVLRSPRAVQVNIHIMRAFVKLREVISAHKDLVHKLDEMEKKYDKQFRVVFEAIRQLMIPPSPAEKRKFGFHTSRDENGKDKTHARKK